MTAVGRLRPTPWLTAASFACVAAVTVSPAAADDPGEIFRAQRDAFLAEGVRLAGGFVFVTVRVPVPPDATGIVRDKSQEKAALEASQRAIAWKLAEQVAPEVPESGLRRAIGDVAATCAVGQLQVSGATQVHLEPAADSELVVMAVPEAGLSTGSMDRARVVDCVAKRAGSGAIPPVEAFVLEELDPQASEPPVAVTRLVGLLARSLGDGFSLSARGAWTTSDRRVVPEAFAGWTGAAAESVRRSGSAGQSLAPLDPEGVSQFSLDDLLSLAAVRVNDPVVLRSLDARLRADGFVRSAGALRFTAAKFVPFEDRPGKRLGNDVRAKVFASPLVVALLLADGDLDAAWGPATACLAPATAAFDEGTPESVARSISLLSDGMGTVPNVDSVSLLAAALLASDEPRLAEPLARAAFNAMPSHKFAGVNALRAQRALDLRDRARVLLPKVAGEAQLGNWGRRQLESVAQWLGVPVPPPAPPKGAAGEG